jgi:hypothetical protein
MSVNFGLRYFSVRRAALLGCLVSLSFLLLGSTAPKANESAPRFEMKSLGDWEWIGDARLDSRELEMLCASDHWRSCFRHRNSGMTATITWLTGPPGPLVSHRPEICCQREAYECQSPATVWAVPNADDEFRVQTFRSRAMDAAAMTIAYAWTRDSVWMAPTYPRLSFATASSLHRVQIAIQHPAPRETEARSEIRRLAAQIALAGK